MIIKKPSLFLRFKNWVSSFFKSEQKKQAIAVYEPVVPVDSNVAFPDTKFKSIQYYEDFVTKHQTLIAERNASKQNEKPYELYGREDTKRLLDESKERSKESEKIHKENTVFIKKIDDKATERQDKIKKLDNKIKVSEDYVKKAEKETAQVLEDFDKAMQDIRGIKNIISTTRTDNIEDEENCSARPTF